MVALVKVATCNLNQWSMDFDLNLKNVLDSIRIAKSAGCRFRTGPELELSGYGCEDHFLEEDTTRHCWESVQSILQSDATDHMLVDVGMPLMHKGVRYNCRIFMLDRKIILIRPKLCLANDGNYRETRWFTAWTRRDLEDFPLPHSIRAATGQYSVPIGHAIVQCDDASVAIETCEELFTPDAPHVELSLAGCDIIANGSGSHHSLHGCASAYINGEMIAQGSQFSVKDVEVVTAVMDLDEIRSFRASIASRSVQAAQGRSIPVVRANHRLCMGTPENGGYSPLFAPSAPMFPRLHTPEEEIAFGPACWLWDYLRRSGASGYFLPLSGGADSAATASMVAIMCHLVVDAIAKGDPQVLADARRVAGVKPDDAYTPTDPREFCLRILHTCYMGTSNSSVETAKRAGSIAKDIGCYHLQVNIDTIVSAVLAVFSGLTGKTPQYKVHGGSQTENLALQNIQARLRMVFSYLLAQLLPWVRSKSGFLLVLGSANVDEALRGYMTKYDCSSADINPIGGIAKGDLARFLRWAAVRFPFPTLAEVVAAPPTAELEPITASYTQTDEIDMGMSYEELGIYGRLRKVYRCGPVSMYQKLVALWTKPGGTAVTAATPGGNEHAHIGNASPSPASPSAAASSSVSAAPVRAPLTPSAVMAKVRHFFYYYSVNRHKLTTLTPSYHAENYSPEDNRFDLRPFLYNTRWTRQFETMQNMANRDEQILAEQMAAAAAATAAHPLALISAAPARPQPHSHATNPQLRKFAGGEGDGLLVHKGASQL